MSFAITSSSTYARSAALDSFLEISRLSLNNAERLTDLNTVALREAFTGSATAVHAFAGITSASEMRAIQSKLVGPMMDKALAYGRSVHDLAAQTQQEISRLMQSQLSALQQKIAKTATQPDSAPKRR